MKLVLATILFAGSLSVEAADNADKNETFAEISYVVFSHRIDIVASQRSSNDRQLYFLESDPGIESRVLDKYHYTWLRPASGFVFDRKTGVLHLKGSSDATATALMVHVFEKTDAGMRCVLTMNNGSLGTGSLRYYLKKEKGAWVVEKTVYDRNLPVS